MRLLGWPFLAALSACGAGSAMPDAGAQPLPCSATVDAYCAQNACVRRAIDRSPCETFFICVEFEVFPGPGGELDYYDHAGRLYAIVVAGTCVAGPTMFTPPFLTTCAQPGPGPCDAGT